MKRFPKILRKCLDDPEARQKFSEEVETEFDEIKVYRAVGRHNEISASDFLGNIEKRIQDGEKCPEKRVRDFHWHSVSVNESMRELIKATHFPNQHIHGIAEGKMQCQYGPADFSEDGRHHNWYLFEGMNAVVCRKFYPVETNGNESGKYEGLV